MIKTAVAGDSKYRQKMIVRQHALSRRDSLDEMTRRSYDVKIRESLLRLADFQNAQKILLYASIRSEVSTFDIIKWCLESGKIVALPRVNRDQGKLEVFEIKGMDELKQGFYGIQEPDVPEARKMSIAGMDAVIIPGVAFDRSCYRLGYGKGFYDKLLSDKKRVDISAMGQECPVLIGLSYEMQIVKELPFKAHDMQVDMIVTEERILRCNEQGKSHGRHTSCH